MRKFLTFLLLLAVMLPNAVRADEIIVGTGASGTEDAPFNNYYNMKQAFTWYASQLKTALQ